MKIKSVQQVLLIDDTIPATRPISNELFKLSEAYTYKIKILIQNDWHVFERFIPEGFLTDKRSVPRALRWARSRDGLCELGAIGHDADYRTAGYTKNMDLGAFCLVDGNYATLSRKACDQLYKYTYDSIRPENTEPERDYFWLRVFGGKEFGQRMPPAIRK